MRLIDADVLWMDVIHAMDYCEDILEIIEKQPTVEERKMGTWRICTEEIEETFHTGSRCTVCNYWKPMGIWKYCPNCGADMRGEEND